MDPGSQEILYGARSGSDSLRVLANSEAFADGSVGCVRLPAMICPTAVSFGL